MTNLNPETNSNQQDGSWFSRVFCSRWTIVWACLAGAVLSIPALWGGLQLDDHHQMQILTGTFPFSVAPSWHTELFTFGDGIAEHNAAKRDAGIYPWWTNPGFKATFSRVLAAMTHALDYRLWPNSPALMHLHSILWYVAAIAMVGLFYRRVFPAAWGAGAAVLLFAIDDIHSVTVVWISNRNAIIAQVFAMGALISHIHGRQTGNLKWLALSPVLLLGGLLAGEAAVATGAFLLAYVLLLDGGPRRSRLLSLLPCAVVGVGWFLIYRKLGFGAAHSMAYVDPGADPKGFAVAVFQRVPVFLTSAFGAMGSELFLFASPWAQNLILIYCWVILLGLFWCVWPLIRRDRLLQFWGLCLVLTILPNCTAMVMDRVLIMVSVASAGFIARWGELLLSRSAAPAGFVPTLLTRLGFWTYAFIAAAVSFPLFPLRIEAWTNHERSMNSTALSPVFDVPDLAEKDVFEFGMPDAMYAWHLGTIRGENQKVKPRSSRLLTTGLTACTLTRTDANTLTVAVPAGVLQQPMSQMWSDLKPASRPGDKIEMPRVTLTITAVAANGDPTEFVCRFPVPLEDRSLLWTRWENDRLVPLELPEVGKSVELAATKDWLDYSANMLLKPVGVTQADRAGIKK